MPDATELPVTTGVRAAGEMARRRKVTTRLSRVEGQIRGIKSLLEEGEDCEAIAIQMAAARRALDRAFYDMLSCGLLTRLDDAADIDDIRGATDELARLLIKYA